MVFQISEPSGLGPKRRVVLGTTPKTRGRKGGGAGGGPGRGAEHGHNCPSPMLSSLSRLCRGGLALALELTCFSLMQRKQVLYVFSHCSMRVHNINHMARKDHNHESAQAKA